MSETNDNTNPTTDDTRLQEAADALADAWVEWAAAMFQACAVAFKEATARLRDDDSK